MVINVLIIIDLPIVRRKQLKQYVNSRFVKIARHELKKINNVIENCLVK